MTSSSQLIPILLNLLAAIFGAAGQYFYKTGARQFGTVELYRNWPIFLGIFLFCLVMVLFVSAFKLGGRLSVVYPAYATTFIWATLIAVYVENEVVNLPQLSGILVILLGVALVGFSAERV